MRRICIVSLLILIMTGSSACLLTPRTAEKPSGTDQYPWVVPNVYAYVLHNLTTGFASNVDSNYQRSLDDATFAFHPTVTDSLNLPGKFNNDWDKTVELAWLRRIKGDYVGARTLRFGDANGNFTSKIEQVNRVILEGEYEITLERTAGAAKEVYAGIARFTLIQGSQGWVMSGWTDLEASGTNPTAGYLRGTFRVAN